MGEEEESRGVVVWTFELTTNICFVGTEIYDQDAI